MLHCGKEGIQSGENIEVENISLQFGGVKALNDVSYHIEEGEIFSHWPKWCW